MYPETACTSIPAFDQSRFIRWEGFIVTFNEKVQMTFSCACFYFQRAKAGHALRTEKTAIVLI